MSEWFIYQPDGNYVGPIATDKLAQGILAGKVPRDAHVATPGDTNWQPVLTVDEIASEVKRLEESQEPLMQRPLPSVPPAPPPPLEPLEPGRPIDFSKLTPLHMPALQADPPTMQLKAVDASKLLDDPPKPVEAPKPPEAKKEEKPGFKPDPKHDVIPLAIFGICVVIAGLLGIVALIARPAAPPPPAMTGGEKSK